MPLLALAAAAPAEVEWLARAGAVGILALVLWLIVTERLVPGPTHKRVVEERDRLLELAITNAHVASRSVEIAERKAPA